VTPTPAPPRVSGRGGYRRVFGAREFRVLFVAASISMPGSIVAGLAVSVLLYRRTGSAFLAASAFALEFLPYLAGVALSALADRLPPRAGMVGASLISAGFAAAMAIPRVPIPVLLLMIVGIGTVAPFFSGIRTAVLTELLPGPSYMLGVSLMGMVAQLSQVGGYALGGLLLAVISPSQALLFDAATFLAAAALLQFGCPRRPPRAGSRGRGAFRDSLAVVPMLSERRALRNVLLLSTLAPMLAVIPEAVANPYVAQHGGSSGHGALGVGLYLAAIPIGTVFGDMAAAQLLTHAGRLRLVRPMVVASFVPGLLFALSPGLPFALTLLVVTGSASCWSMGLGQLPVELSPPDMLGRVITLSTSLQMVTQGLGFAAGGAVADALPAADVIVIGSIAGLLMTAALVRRPLASQS
jgi:predicted MFS family arabinose efflux permease